MATVPLLLPTMRASFLQHRVYETKGCPAQEEPLQTSLAVWVNDRGGSEAAHARAPVSSLRAAASSSCRCCFSPSPTDAVQLPDRMNAARHIGRFLCEARMQGEAEDRMQSEAETPLW